MKFQLASAFLVLTFLTLVSAQGSSTSHAILPSGVPGHSSLSLPGFPSPTETVAPGTATTTTPAGTAPHNTVTTTTPAGTPTTTHPATTAATSTTAGAGTSVAASNSSPSTTPGSSSDAVILAPRTPITPLVALAVMGAAFAIHL